ncbi:MAG: hypothetical protein GF409_02695 [Candidatus Omnitrophica bacterium]|nr:hypothetical protein [Candidatus Omnitrophota bacterium]
MDRLHISLIGFAAGICTTLSFVPQVVKILRTKRARDISLYMYIILTLGIFLWLVYGILIGEFPIVLANGITLCFCLMVLVSKAVYSRGDKGLNEDSADRSDRVYRK